MDCLMELQLQQTMKTARIENIINTINLTSEDIEASFEDTANSNNYYEFTASKMKEQFGESQNMT